MISTLNSLISIFQTILIMSGFTAVLCGVILIVKVSAGHLMSARSQALIWLALLPVLLVPFTIISLPAEVLTTKSAEVWKPVRLTVAQIAADPIVLLPDEVIEPNATYNLPSTEPNIIIPSNNEVNLFSFSLTTSQIIWLSLSFIWILGALALLLIYMFNYRKAIRMVRISAVPTTQFWQIRLTYHAENIGIGTPNNINLSQSYSSRSPFVIGLSRCSIVLPAYLLDQTDTALVDSILIHELIHIKHRDHWLRLLQCFLLSIHWFNPLCWLAFRLQQRDCEFYCDETSVGQLSGLDRASYAQALLATTLCCTQANESSLVNRLLTASFAEDNLRDRIIKILHKRKTSSTITVAAMLLVILAGCSILPGLAGVSANKVPVPSSSENDNLHIPSSYEKSITSADKKVEISVRADVLAEVDADYPVYTLRSDISNEYASKIMNALFGDKELYTTPVYGGEFTYGKDFLDYAINACKANLGTADSEKSNDYLQEQLIKYQNMYDDAPETMFLVPAIKTFSPLLDIQALLRLEKEWKDGILTDEVEYLRQKDIYENAIENNEADNLSIEGLVDLGDNMLGQLFINKTIDNDNDYVFYVSDSIQGFVEKSIEVYTTPYVDYSSEELVISEADAISMANKLLLDMGADYLVLGEINISETPNRTEYQLSYYRGSSLKFNMRVNNHGVRYLDWHSPKELVEQRTESVEMLDFAEVMRIFDQQILGNTIHSGDDSKFITKTEYIIDSIVLSSMIVPQLNSTDEYAAIPVWDFGGYQIITYSEDYADYVKLNGGYPVDDKNQRKVEVEEFSYLTINAVDGSIINRSRIK